MARQNFTLNLGDPAQVGTLESAFNYDFPINLMFLLNNLEINLIIFTSAIVLAAFVICILHIKYQVSMAHPVRQHADKYRATFNVAFPSASRGCDKFFSHNQAAERI